PKNEKGAGPAARPWVFTIASTQHVPPPRTRKNASISASVPMSPSRLKSAVLVQGAAGQLPAMQAKNDSMSASVPVSPSQLQSAEPHCGGTFGTGTPPALSAVGAPTAPGLNSPIVAVPVTGATFAVNPKLNVSAQRRALAFWFWAYVWVVENVRTLPLRA